MGPQFNPSIGNEKMKEARRAAQERYEKPQIKEPEKKVEQKFERKLE